MTYCIITIWKSYSASVNYQRRPVESEFAKQTDRVAAGLLVSRWKIGESKTRQQNLRQAVICGLMWGESYQTRWRYSIALLGRCQRASSPFSITWHKFYSVRRPRRLSTSLNYCRYPYIFHPPSKLFLTYTIVKDE